MKFPGLKFSYFITALLFIYCTSWAQKTRELVSDRPDITESAIPIPINTLQIETGFQYQKQKFVDIGIQMENENFSIASTLFRYGINDKIEFRFGGQYSYNNLMMDSVRSDLQGVSDIFVGTKLSLLENGNYIDNIALLFEAVLPFGNAELRPNNIEPSLIFALSKRLNERLNVAVNIGTQIGSESKKFNYFYSASCGIALYDRIGMFAEYFGNSESTLKTKHNFDIGFTYLQKENIQIDFSCGSEISERTNWFAGIGFTVRLPK